MSQIKVNSIVDAAGGSAAVLYGVASPPNSMGFRNRIINGDMRIDQRRSGAALSPAVSGDFLVDRFIYSGSQASKFFGGQNYNSVTPPAGFTNYVGVQCSTAYAVGASDNFRVIQRIEGFNVADLAWGTSGAQPVTMSFRVYSSLTGTFGGALTNSASNRSYPFSYTVSVANTWTTVSVFIAGDQSGTWLTNNGTGIEVNFGLGVGSALSGTAGTWTGSGLLSATGAISVVGTQFATFYITGVQLEAGTVATPFERRDYGRELMMCQRYYQLTGGYFAATGSGNQLDAIGSCNVKVEMRADPTATLPAGVRFHKPGIAFYPISSVDAGPKANGNGYQVCTIASGAGTSTPGQISEGLILSAEL